MVEFTEKEAEALAEFVDDDVTGFAEVASELGMSDDEVEDLLVKLLKCLKEDNA